MAEPVYRRVVIKISGEFLAGKQGFGIDQTTVDRIAGDLIAPANSAPRSPLWSAAETLSGRRSIVTRRLPPDRRYHGHARHRDELPCARGGDRARGMPARSLSAFVMPQICELFTRGATHKYLAEGRIVLLGGGTGNPFFTTDTTAVLRAAEIGAQAVLKATNVDGVYSADPKKDPSAKRFDRLTHSTGDRRRLQGHGCHRIRACPRDVAAYHRILDCRAGFDRCDPAGHRPRHHRRRLTGLGSIRKRQA
jgi:Uridylate kinase